MTEWFKQTASGTFIVMDRQMTDDFCYVLTEMHLVHDGRSFLERVRLHQPPALERLFTGAGLRIEHRLDSYDGRPVRNDAPRVILIRGRA